MSGPQTRVVMFRDAFKSAQLYEHRIASSTISATALNSEAGLLYIGLTDGYLEEYSVKLPAKAALHLSARRKVSNKPIQRVRILRSLERIAVQSNGCISLLDRDALEGERVAGAKGVTAFDALDSPASALLLAVATRSNKRDASLMVYSLPKRHGLLPPSPLKAVCVQHREVPQSLAIKDLVWVGHKLVFCSALEYTLFDPASGQAQVLLSLQEDAISKTLVAYISGAKQAILLMDRVGIVIDDRGQPVSSAFTFPVWPSALVASGSYVLAVCPDAVHIYDLASSERVQSLLLGSSQQAEHQLHAVKDCASPQVLVASSRRIWLLTPIATEDQAKQLLQAGNYTAFKMITKEAAGRGDVWAHIAFAESGYRFLFEGFFLEAADAFLTAGPTVFQPLLLFPLFPNFTEPWRHLPTPKQLWSLHAVLPPLQQLVARNPVAEEVAEAERCVVQYLAKVRDRPGVAAQDGVDTLLALLLSRLHMEAPLEDLMRSPNHVRLESAEASLRSHGSLVALGLLLAARQRATEALDVWKACVGSSDSISGTERSLLCICRLLSSSKQADVAMLMHHFPWLLQVSPQDALAVAQARDDAEPAVILAAIEEGRKELAWTYLQHLVERRASGHAEHHTALASLLIDNIVHLSPQPDVRPQSISDLMAFNQCSKPAWERAAKVRFPDSASYLRAHLLRHLQASELYNRAVVQAQLRETDLFKEQAIVLEKMGKTEEALEIMALVLGDVDSAQALCQRKGSKEAYMSLLAMLLHPKDRQPAKYLEACRVLASPGVTLDPMGVVEALSDEMPLAFASDIFARMLRERLHRHRQALILRNLHRCTNLTAAAERAKAFGRKITVAEATSCHLCHTRLGNKMFWVYPDGSLACYKCANKRGNLSAQRQDAEKL